MNPLVQEMTDMKPRKKFFIGFDSDGCVFDSMDIKHKECFCPAFINNFERQGVSNRAREVWEFVNLYSKTRGLNRFLAVIHAVELISGLPEVKERQISLPSISGLVSWTERETRLGQAALEEEVKTNPEPDLLRALAWSKDISEAVNRIIRNLPPFPQVKEVLKSAAGNADMMVVSQTPTSDLTREWGEHGIDEFVRMIAGQERGTKSEHLRFSAVGKYQPDHILLVGDAPGDLKAAQENKVLFFPIVPGSEKESWNRLRDDALNRFFDGDFSGEYQNGLLEEFNKALPETADWM